MRDLTKQDVVLSPDSVTIADDTGDRIEQGAWGRLITLLDRLPRDERVDDADPEPFV
jgi:hypothetical protein